MPLLLMMLPVTITTNDTVGASVTELQRGCLGSRGFGVQRPIPFDFLVEGEFLRSSISSYLEDGPFCTSWVKHFLTDTEP